MPLRLILKKMGGGKTLVATMLADLYSRRHPGREIYANYELDLPTARYTPFMFLPLSRLENCMVIVDDMEAMDNLKRLQSVITNISRKKNLNIVCTGQYYTQFPRKMRSLADYFVVPSYSEKSRSLFYRLEWRAPDGDLLRKSQTVRIGSPGDFFDIYDTGEVVAFPLQSDIEREILKFSETPRDLRVNCFLAEGSRRRREKLVERLMAEKGWDTGDGPSAPDYDSRAVMWMYLNKVRNVPQTEIAGREDTQQSSVSMQISQLEAKIDEEAVRRLSL